MIVKEVDPYNVNVDEMNERKENLNLSELEKSVAEQGVIQPPIVRERNGDHEVDYTVVVGQRRTLAAQGAGIDEMPVVVMKWGDAKALEASITENIDTFREDVSKRDRALAVKRLRELNNWTKGEVAEHLGVSRDAVTNWTEPLQDEWEGTIVDPSVEGNDDRWSSTEISVDDFSDQMIRRVRQSIGGGDEGEELLKRIHEHDLGEEDVNELTRKIDSGRNVDQALAQTIEEKHSSGKIKVNTNVTFSGDYAGALTNYAKERGMTENEVVREAIQDYLDREGYL